jgi:hypothetical protein
MLLYNINSKDIYNIFLKYEKLYHYLFLNDINQ